MVNSYKYLETCEISNEKKKYILSSKKSKKSNLKPDEIFFLWSKHLNLKLTNESVQLPTQVFLIREEWIIGFNESSEESEFQVRLCRVSFYFGFWNPLDPSQR